jgi:hypothetical protein
MTRLAAITGWILLGGAITGALYWGFLNTPESSVLTLVESAILALLTLAYAGITINGALLAWSSGVNRGLFRQALVRVPAFLWALVVALMTSWLAGAAATWVTTNSGPINAWFIARFGWADASPFFTGVAWLTTWVRWVWGPLAALSLLASLLSASWAALASLAWLRAALSPARLALGTIWFAALVAAPWIYAVPWRPRGLPASSVEIAFIGTKLLLCAVVMAIGVALMARTAMPRARTP